MTDEARDVIERALSGTVDLDASGDWYDETDAILAALTAAGVHLMRWQDISEAPKDGTKILAYTVHGDYELPHWYVIEDWDFEPVGDGLFRKVMRKPTEGWNGNMPVKFCHLPPAPPEPGL